MPHAYLTIELKPLQSPQERHREALEKRYGIARPKKEKRTQRNPDVIRACDWQDTFVERYLEKKVSS